MNKLLLLALIFFQFISFSQDEEYIEAINYNSYVQTFATIKYKNIFLSDTLGFSQKYKVNNPTIIGIGGNYKWITINLGLPVNDGNSSTRGKTKKYFLGGRWSTKKFKLEGEISAYRGFYAKHRDSNLIFNDTALFIKRPDINTTLVYISGEYIFNNKRISFRSAFDNTQKQIKSAGSWVMGLSAFYNDFTSKLPVAYFYPDSITLESDELIGSNSYNIGLNGGYMYSLVLKDVIISSQISLPLYYTNARNTFTTHSQKFETVNIGGVFKLFVGFNVRSWFGGAGLTAIGLMNSNEKTGVEVTQSQSKVDFYFGKRLNLNLRKNKPKDF